MRFDILFLDLDGTLVDSGADIAASLNWALKRVGEPELPEKQIIAAIGGGVPVLLDRTIGPSHPKRERIHAGLREHYRGHLMDRTTLYPGVRETLEAISIPRVMITNKPEDMSRKLVEGLGIGPLFAAIYGGEGRLPRKPDPASILEALGQFKAAKSRALHVGDSGVDLATARAAGIKCCAVTYGYSVPGELDGADFTISRFADLAGLLRD